MRKWTILRGDRSYTTDPFGFLSYPNWRIIGAVRFNNFGHIVEEKTFFEFDTIKDWKYKNGKQKWFIKDLEHGTVRIWMNPPSTVYPG